jgi:hypothetical protein
MNETELTLNGQPYFSPKPITYLEMSWNRRYHVAIMVKTWYMHMVRVHEQERPCKVKVKAAFWGLFGTEAFEQAYCTLAPRNFLPSPLEALCISQTHSALC